MAGSFAFNILGPRLFPDAFGDLARELTLGRKRLLLSAGVRVVMGCIIVWLYAAARFRLRSTLKTAGRVGVAVWFVAYAPLLAALYMLNVFPTVAVAFLGAWGFVEMVTAALVGGLVHQRRRPPGRY